MTSAPRHIAILSSPTPGHFNPLQVLGAELVALGHRVTLVHVAGAARFVRDPAIGFAALPDPAGGVDALDRYLATLARPTGPYGLNRMIRATAGMTQALLSDAPGVLERIGADAVIADAVEPAGALIARRIGVPHVVAVTGLPLLREDAVPPPFLGWRYRPDALGRFRNRGGYAVSDWLMRPIARVLDDQRRAWGLAPVAVDDTLQVAQCPRGLDYPRADLPPGFVYGAPWRHPPAADLALPDDGRPLIFCSLGTLQGARRSLFARIARACAAIGARAVIGHGGGLTPVQAAGLPGDPLVRDFWPQEAILRRCVAAVLHGGFNSVLDALAAGVPILALPIAFEQPATAARLARVGAGRILRPGLLDGRTLAAALDDLVRRPSWRAAAGRLAGEMAAAGGARHAAALVSAALSGRH